MVSSASWSKLVSPLKMISDQLGRPKFTDVLVGRPLVGAGVSVAQSTTSVLLLRLVMVAVADDVLTIGFSG